MFSSNCFFQSTRIVKQNLATIRTNIDAFNTLVAEFPSVFEWAPPAAGSVAFPRCAPALLYRGVACSGCFACFGWDARAVPSCCTGCADMCTLRCTHVSMDFCKYGCGAVPSRCPCLSFKVVQGCLLVLTNSFLCVALQAEDWGRY